MLAVSSVFCVLTALRGPALLVRLVSCVPAVVVEVKVGVYPPGVKGLSGFDLHTSVRVQTIETWVYGFSKK